MSSTNDLIIRDGVLVDYKGKGGTVEVPEGVVGILAHVFRWKDVEEVILPESLQWMGDGVFDWCRKLRRLRLPGSLKVVPRSLCDGCEALTELALSEGIRYLSQEAFQGCALTSLIIPASVRVIGDSCFASCEDLTDLSLGEGLRRIGEYAFYQCSSLRAVRFPASLRHIETNAFTSCTNLKSVSIPTGLKVLGEFSFQHCEELREVVFPESLEVVWLSAFRDSPGLKRVTFRGQRTAFRVDNPNCPLPPDLAIRTPDMPPDWLPAPFRPAFPAGPLRVHNGVLYGVARSEGQVVVPEGVTGIRAEAFQGTAIREIRLPDSVQWLQAGAFQYCGQLAAVRLPDGLTHIPEFLFRNCRALRSIRIPEGVQRIGDQAFQACGLESLALPASVKTVGARAFEDCGQLRNVRFAEGLREICANAFEECSALQQVALPDSLELLGEEVFSQCEALEEVEIGKGLRELDSTVFDGCRRLRGLDLPANVRTLRPGDFPEPEGGFPIRMDASFIDIDTGELGFSDSQEDPDNFDGWMQAGALRLIAPNADPSIMLWPLLRALLRGFSRADGVEFRYKDQYLKLLAARKREFWAEPDILRGLMRFDLLEREDLGPCLDTLQRSGKPELAAELLDYWHRRYPEPQVFELPPLDLDSDPES